MTDWGGIAGEVDAGLSEVGTPATLIQPGASTGPEYDPTPGTPVETTGTAVISKFRRSEIDGTLIQTGDLKILLTAQGMPKPSTVDRLRIDGVEYAIVNVESVQPGAVPVLYTLQVRT